MQEHPVRVFISYAHTDDKLCDEFVKAMSGLQQELTGVWRDRGIAPGTDWSGEIDERLKQAEIIALLVSSDFLASDYCKLETKIALERSQAGSARVIPVILRSCDWQTASFAKLQVLPRRGKPVANWKRRDDAFLNIVEGLRSVAAGLSKGGVQAAATRGVQEKLRRRWPAYAGIGALVVALTIAGFFWTKQNNARQAAAFVTQGNALFQQSKWKESEDAYQRARDLDPNNNDAYFGLGTVYDLGKDPDNAAKMFEQAAKLSPRPEYKSNLADEYFKLGQYKRAADEYDQIAEFPAAALESAKINRLRNNLDVALQRNYLAIRWLNDKRIASSPENQLAWYFITNDEKGTRIVTADEKLCYAQFELSITLFLQGNAADAAKDSAAAPQACGQGHALDIKAQLISELERLANERPELAGRGKEYIRQFLTATHP